MNAQVGLTVKYPLHYTEELDYVFGSLAQLVEQRTFNPLVASSNLARPTILFSFATYFPNSLKKKDLPLSVLLLVHLVNEGKLGKSQ